jgi:hypothetical protein
MATTAFQTPRKEQMTAPRSVKLTETEKRQLLENLDIEGASAETKTSLLPMLIFLVLYRSGERETTFRSLSSRYPRELCD